ncbi:C4-dicarboxylate ABC transporter permease [candidate division KSB3 bacterium]|uniref:C4-dicarboxylate ABC transporter permease n=1 Tax=candidate division KSB3 bacterium TaxID=2044937 RepID=A0A2G6E258_9BACT|nr:MAG: C4-dicarboxylate ABC transporter permease [candidate division KSB3 bacterium]PIE28461.1 MAG: C4-dicarboxylate ABC transporter permease [candidate division KSB3 bacterium]
MEVLIEAFRLVVTPEVLLTIILASCMGVVIGSIPGLTAVMGTALLVPITFYLDPLPAISAIVAMTAMAIFAGDIPGALVRIPGTPASAAYVDEAYNLTLAGQPERGLGICMASACAGGMMGSMILVLAAPQLARIAVKFSSVEYFWLALLGLTCAAFVSSASALKGVLSLLTGLFISTIGIDTTSGQSRFTFGVIELMGGVNYIPAMIGMFALSEILRTAASPLKKQLQVQAIKHIMRGLGRELRQYRSNIVRGGLIGTLVGALPGAGADIAAWVAYSISRKFSKTPERFGKGHLEGLAESGAANNASLSGAWVPALVFGIPGDSITAIVIGVLILKGMEPGPVIFIKQPQMVYAVFISFFIANLLLLPIGYVIIRLSRVFLAVPPSALIPIVLLACIVGSFAINNTSFDIGVMMVMGLIGCLMEENGIPVAPAILGIVLGNMLEFNFVTTMIKAKGDLVIFFSRPIAAGLGIVTLSIWLSQIVLAFLRNVKKQKPSEA